MASILQYLAIGVVVSMFYFSFGFTFLPASINTKMILAIIGVLLGTYHAIQNRTIKIGKPLLGAIGIVILFSLICFIAVDYNYTADYSYATYFVSFAVWLFSAYTICVLLQWAHGEINFKLITYYLAGVCFAQCCFALIIDSVPSVQFFIDSYIDQGQEFLTEINRLYGIGAALDPAGVRFSVVLIMIAAVLSKEQSVRESYKQIAWLLSCFFIIIIVGNIISRTTSIGAGLALVYFLWNTGILRLSIKPTFYKLNGTFLIILVAAFVVSAYFYQTDKVFHEHIRFAFEGFFNWIEKGEWRTDSTDKLNNKMWIWPDDLKTWVIGTGLFDNWVFSTDIGYSRFILYCGLIGFTVFALFFVYNAAVFASLYPHYRDLFFFLFVLTFVIWIKVATDIFLIYALFYCMNLLNSSKILTTPNENSLLHSRYA